MKNRRRLKRTAFGTGTMFLTSAVLLFMLVGTSLALTNPVFIHGYAANGSIDTDTQIILRDADNNAITVGGTDTKKAFSAKKTCGYCHNGGISPQGFDSDGNPLLSYDEIERHAYHAQIGANELTGYNVAGSSPWVQSEGHFGKW